MPKKLMWPRRSIRRAALAFDTSQIPAGSIVTAANLSVHVSRARGGAQNHSVHKLMADWGDVSIKFHEWWKAPRTWATAQSIEAARR